MYIYYIFYDNFIKERWEIEVGIWNWKELYLLNIVLYNLIVKELMKILWEIVFFEDFLYN